jgi:hypothetical protein
MLEYLLNLNLSTPIARRRAAAPWSTKSGLAVFK